VCTLHPLGLTGIGDFMQLVCMLPCRLPHHWQINHTHAIAPDILSVQLQVVGSLCTTTPDS